MENDESGNTMVAVTAKVPRELRDEIDSMTAHDEPRSAVMRRLIRTGISVTDQSVTSDAITTALLIVAMVAPTYLAHIGEPVGAAMWIAALTVSMIVARLFGKYDYLTL